LTGDIAITRLEAETPQALRKRKLAVR